MGRFDEADPLLQRAAELRPNDPEVHTNIGFNNFRQKDYDAAEQSFLRAIEKDANYFPAHFALSRVYQKTKNHRAAISSLKEYLRARPDAPDHSQVKETIARLQLRIESS